MTGGYWHLLPELHHLVLQSNLTSLASRPPSKQALFCFFWAELPLVEAKFHHETSRFTHLAAGFQIEDAHDIFTAQIGSDRVKFFLFLQGCNALFEVVPVVRLDGRPVGTGRPGVRARALQRALLGAVDPR